jgi:REP element-mobilizing transposase RayT
MVESSLYRRNLPHVRSEGATYFVTWRIASAQIELDEASREIVAQALRHFDGARYQLLAYVVMNDHVHTIVTPAADMRLQDILHSWKSFSAHRLQRGRGRTGKVWQDESFDRVIRDDWELLEKLTYVASNPSKRWPGIETYRWMGGSLLV